MANVSVLTYEVEVEVKKKGSKHYSSHIGMYIESKTTKMYHIDATKHDKAMRKAERYGRPIHARKLNIDKLRGNIENILQPKQYGGENPFENAIAMSDMVWRKKSKRALRLANRGRDKGDGY